MRTSRWNGFREMYFKNTESWSEKDRRCLEEDGGAGLLLIGAVRSLCCAEQFRDETRRERCF